MLLVSGKIERKGLNLKVASKVLFLDSWCNPQLIDQFIARAQHMSGKHHIEFVKIRFEHTFKDRVREMYKQKRNMMTEIGKNHPRDWSVSNIDITNEMIFGAFYSKETIAKQEKVTTELLVHPENLQKLSGLIVDANEKRKRCLGLVQR